MKDSFQLLLNVGWYVKKDVLNKGIVIVSRPKPQGLKWYKLVLYYLSFKKLFRSDIIGWKYKVKLI